MKNAFLKDGEFLFDVEKARSEPDRLHLWWLGQSGFLVQWEGKHLLLDPYLSDSLTRKYETTPKPHVRVTERVIAPEELDFIDVVTSSHNHTDHLDAATLIPLLKANPKIQLLIPEANRAFVVDRLKLEIEFPRGLETGHSKTITGFTFHGVPAAHPELDRDEWGRDKFMGYVVECGPWKIYHSGDTFRFPGMAELLQPFGVDLALLPINGDVPERQVIGNLNGADAARLAKDIGAKRVIPCHYDMFEFNSASPEEFTSTCDRLGQAWTVLKNGERCSLTPP